MSITQSFCLQYKRELWRGIHQAGDEYRMALYTAVASLDKNTKAYTPEGEVPDGGGYAAGGQALAGFEDSLDGDTSVLSFTIPVWPAATITARGALIYNASRGNRALAVLDFGKDYTSTNGDWRPNVPGATGSAGLLRIA
jgi:hypothetical protein